MASGCIDQFHVQEYQVALFLGQDLDTFCCTRRLKHSSSQFFAISEDHSAKLTGFISDIKFAAEASHTCFIRLARSSAGLLSDFLSVLIKDGLVTGTIDLHKQRFPFPAEPGIVQFTVGKFPGPEVSAAAEAVWVLRGDHRACLQAKYDLAVEGHCPAHTDYGNISGTVHQSWERTADLSHIVPSGPGKVTHYGRARRDDRPVFRNHLWICFTAYHQPFRILFIIRQITGGHIIIAQHIH